MPRKQRMSFGLLGLLVAGGVALAQEFALERVEGLILENGFDAGWAGDLDSDGIDDLVCVSGQVRFFFGKPEGGFTVGDPLLDASTTRLSLVVADLDGDGLLDLATGSRFSGTHVIWNQGNRVFQPEFLDRSRGAQSLQAVDINRDGKLDLLSADRLGSGDVLWYEVARGTAAAHLISSGFTEPFAAVAGNLDDDEALELVVSSEAGHCLMDWKDAEEPPGGSFRDARLLTTANTNGRHVILEDFDLDGKLDIAMAIRQWIESPVETKVVWLRNEGGLSFDTRQLATQASTAYYRWIEAADLDGDGDPDLAVSRWINQEPQFAVFLNDGAGNFFDTELGFRTVGNSMLTFTTWDYRGDGRRGIVPGRSSRQGDWPIIIAPREDLAIEVGRKGGETQITWRSRPDYLYRLQFSPDLRSWSDSYLAEGEPITPSRQRGTGQELNHVLRAPDEPTLYLRVIGAKQPEEEQ